MRIPLSKISDELIQRTIEEVEAEEEFRNKGDLADKLALVLSCNRYQMRGRIGGDKFRMKTKSGTPLRATLFLGGKSCKKS